MRRLGVNRRHLFFSFSKGIQTLLPLFEGCQLQTYTLGYKLYSAEEARGLEQKRMRKSPSKSKLT